MAVSAVAVPRGLARPRSVDARIIAAVCLGLLGLVGNLGLLGVLAPAEHDVVVVAHDLPAGASLGPGDLVRARVQVPDDVLAGLVPGNQVDQLVGRTLAERVHAHDLLARARLAGATEGLAPGQVEVELPLRPETAVVDTLQPGDPVMVLATLGAGKAETSGGSGTRGGLAAVLLVVSENEAVALADAQASGTLLIALAGPEPQP